MKATLKLQATKEFLIEYIDENFNSSEFDEICDGYHDFVCYIGGIEKCSDIEDYDNIELDKLYKEAVSEWAGENDFSLAVGEYCSACGGNIYKKEVE